MERLYKLGKRICPNCGKNLIFEPPNMHISPNIICIDSLKPYYIARGRHPVRGQKCRLFRYTSKRYEYRFIPYYLKNSNINHAHGVPLTKAKRLLERDHIFNTDLIMFCENCNADIAVDRNPCRLIRYYFIYPLTLMYSGMLIFGFWNLNIGLLFALLGALALSVMLLISLVYYIIIKRYYSNFVVRDSWDRLVMPFGHLMLQISTTQKYFKKFVFSESNILSTDVSGVAFHLYAIDDEFPIVRAHICGIEGEPRRLLTLIREKQVQGKEVTLSLIFEGKHVGDAKVLEIYDPPEHSAKEDD